MSTAAGNEKNFENFLNTPAEIRELIIYEMHADDRCRFRRVSKLCNYEATRSKNYLYGLELSTISKTEIEMQITFHETETFGYSLKFTKEAEKSFSTYTSACGIVMEKYELEGVHHMPLFDVAVGHFSNFLKMHQNAIKRLVIHRKSYTNLFKEMDLGITSLKRIEVLKLNNSSDFKRLFAYVRKPLIELQCWRNENELFHFYFETIRQTTYFLTLPHLRLNKEQFYQLSAPRFIINIGELSEEDIYEYVKLWKDGTIKKKLRNGWVFGGTHFDVRALFRRFRIEADDFEGLKKVMRHDKEPKKCKIFVIPNMSLLCFATQ